MNRLDISYKEDLIIPNSPQWQRYWSSRNNGYEVTVLDSPRGIGKTTGICLDAFDSCASMPGLIWGIARSEHASIKETIVPTMENNIIKYPFGDRRNPFTLKGGIHRPERIIFNNGSVITFFGMDKLKRSGAEVDIFYLNEAQREESSLGFSNVSGGMGGRAGNLYLNGERWSQIIMDCNPLHKFLWLYQMGHPDSDQRDNSILWLELKHTDNPLYRNPDGTLNKAGHKYREFLRKRYTQDYDRMRNLEGIWCQAAGTVYSMWISQYEIEMSIDELRERQPIWHLAIDHGGTSPFAVALVAQIGKTWNIFKEIVRSKCNIEDIIGDLISL